MSVDDGLQTIQDARKSGFVAARFGRIAGESLENILQPQLEVAGFHAQCGVDPRGHFDGLLDVLQLSGGLLSHLLGAHHRSLQIAGLLLERQHGLAIGLWQR